MNKIIHTFIAIGLILALTSCADEKTKKSSPQEATALQVEAYKVVTQSFNNELTTTANLIAKEHAELVAPMAGQVLAIYFKEGQRVNKGQPLIRMDDRSWKAQLLGVKAELDAAEKDYARKLQLLTVEGSNQEEIDNAFSKIEMLKSQQQQLQINIDLANISAPFSGELGMRDFSEGAFLKQGDLITTLSANNQLKVDFSIAQMHSNSIKLNKPVRVLIDNDTIKANVYAINPIINTETRTLNVRALLNQKSGKKIKPGTFAEVLIATDMINDAILIPTQAVIPSINGQTVFLYKNGKAISKEIEMGNRNADNVLVQGGLSVGDTVITTGLLLIKDGMDLEIQTIK